LRVHIIEPAGFVWDSRDFRRAGMDYVGKADVVRQPDWSAFLAAKGGGRLVLATTSGAVRYTAFRFAADDIILMGRESSGVPDSVKQAVPDQVCIPMQPGTRSLNVAVATAMITGEALRQTHWS
jgi:tRNA (cytidine/uridine-2'-O-)-methyltransferase